VPLLFYLESKKFQYRELGRVRGRIGGWTTFLQFLLVVILVFLIKRRSLFFDPPQIADISPAERDPANCIDVKIDTDKFCESYESCLPVFLHC